VSGDGERISKRLKSLESLLKKAGNYGTFELMQHVGRELFGFEGYTLDLTRGWLFDASGDISLRPKSFQLLRYLVENAGRLISKDELIASLWPNVIISDESLARCVSDVRHALKGAGRRIVKTVPCRGYLFAAPVSASACPIAPPLPLPDKPSIAVLPFQNMSGDPQQEYFAYGMVEEIITALSHIRWLFVIARNSSFTYKDQAIDIKRVGRELGVRYVLEGSVRKAGGRVRITAQLIDATNGAHLWADRFDGSLEDVFDLQDKVASSVAGVIEPALQAAETKRSVDRPTNDLTAYDLYLRAYAMILSSAPTQIPEALRLLQQAIECDPRYGPALVWSAICYMRLSQDGLSQDPQVHSRKGIDVARRALQVAGDDPAILANAGFVLAYFGEDIGAMIALVDRALELNPNYARGWHISSNLRLWAGHLDRAIAHVETALRLSPRIRIGLPFMIIGAAHFFARRFDEAVPKLLRAIQESPSHPPPYRCLAACCAHMGRLNEARDTILRLRALTPVVVPSVIPYRNPDHREFLLSGLRLAADDAI
jgi:adenylate cyclase